MASQHKRSGKKAKLERQRRVMEAEQQKERERQELLAMRAAIKVILPRRQSRDYYDIHPGHLVAWADGRIAN